MSQWGYRQSRGGGSFSIKSRFNVCKRFHLDQSRTNSTFFDQIRKSVSLGNFCLKLAGINGEGAHAPAVLFSLFTLWNLAYGVSKDSSWQME